MFNNPLKKYQQGGQVSQEQQQMLAAFVEWLPKRVKEFQGMQPEQIVEALNGMSKTPEGQKQVQAYMQQFQQEMQNSQAGMFKDGGKLHDFICKYKNGAKIAGCGCKEDGGKVNKAKDGEKLEDSAPERYYNENGVSSELNRYTTRPGRMLYVETPTPRGNINFEFNQLNRAVPEGLNLPIEYDVQTRSMLDDFGSVGQQQLPLYQMPYFSQLKAQGAAYQEDGGVIKGQSGLAKIGKAGARWIKSASGNRILVDNKGKVIMKEIVEGRSSATPAAAKILEYKEPYETARALDYGDRARIHLEYNDYPWSVKQSAFEAIHPGERLFQPYKFKTRQVDLPKVTSDKQGGVVKGQSGLAKIGKAVVNTAKSARKTGAYVPGQAIGKPFFTNTVKISNSISPERYKAVINWRLANDPNYKLSLDSMERAMQSMGNTDVAYDLYRLKNFGATNKAEFLQFEDMMNRGLTGNQVINSLKVRPGNNGIFPLDLGSGHYAKEAEQMVLHPYVSGIGNFKKGGVVNNNKPTWINRIKK